MSSIEESRTIIHETSKGAPGPFGSGAPLLCRPGTHRLRAMTKSGLFHVLRRDVRVDQQVDQRRTRIAGVVVYVCPSAPTWVPIRVQPASVVVTVSFASPCTQRMSVPPWCPGRPQP